MGRAAWDILAQRLEAIRGQGLERSLVPTGPANGPYITLDGKRTLLLASNDYLGLSRHPRLARAAARAAQESGAGAGASRLVSGTLDGHAELEAACARFKHTEAALFLSSGYLANLAAVSGLAGPGDLVVSDELNHASLIDGCRLSRARVEVYPHGDAKAAERLLAGWDGEGLKLIATDGVFSMDGDLAPAPELLEAAQRHGALLLVDDAHATGVYGASGRGTMEHFGLRPSPSLITVGTFSKALGGFGGFVAGPRVVVDSLINRARPFIFTTSPPPAQVAACLESFRVLDDEPWRREKLHHLAGLLREGLSGMGLSLCSEAGPIIPILVGEAQKSHEMAMALRGRGVFAPAIRPPTVPQGTSRIRLTITAAHEEADVARALEAIQAAAREVGL